MQRRHTEYLTADGLYKVLSLERASDRFPDFVDKFVAILTDAELNSV